ncbi:MULTISPECIES: transcriptional regulator GcvA [Burkholderia]|uniref:Transcriptional regulator, LysR family protein n=1 Tax=Burkholderia gladioli (strain BSR3) TaxID=999541 RepID=F2LP58_BURGS|nr:MULTISPECIES: transcriptional regulator GcvA [Burkholderia]AEA64924.1 Transcriptional regulator, LysR family protein [Burkholderia gladioli BSR3]MBW5283291.1 transcriptional regulator GcvA [Burkholderia gladioli]NIE85275.1 transcriptional regulator GcvA [Burkholderia sp. Tr-860]NIF63199.1 transcriptional regulator GcvA [Burkholderia sp. Cy-647]NIF72287.1 transcriptional regulator GcvA [Burkholderia sp. Ap-962]
MSSPNKYSALPSLRALRYFVSVGRHRSIKTAAEEIHVTPSAISQQIVKLEEELGVSLLQRSPRGIDITPHGIRYLQELQQVFDLILRATDRLRSNANHTDIVTVSCAHSFAMQWLVPRLSELSRVAPGVDLRISTTNRYAAFVDDQIDFAVRHGAGRYQGLKSELLLDDPLYPICNPRLIEQAGPFQSFQDLGRVTLLHDERHKEWLAWLDRYQVGGVRGDRGTMFIDSNGVIHAALACHGVALARKSIIASELADGRLTILFDAPITPEYAYYLVYPEQTLDNPSARVFRQWLMEAVKNPRPAEQPVVQLSAAAD